MTAEYVVQILHGVGFLTGIALYGMLVAMVLRDARPGAALGGDDSLAMLTGVLGLVWNVGAFLLVTHPRPSTALSASAYAALGLLPAVFVHAAARSWKREGRGTAAGRAIVVLGYALSGGAALAQVGAAAASGRTPSPVAFEILAGGFLVIVVLMVKAAPPDARRRGGFVWTAALVLFSVSAWHLAQHEPGAEAWHEVVLGHHASIPLALAILWIDYRFALADTFLKRALAILVLVTVVVGLYFGLYGVSAGREPQLSVSPRWVLVGLALFTTTALCYPIMRGATAWFVDVVLLKRPDAGVVRADVVRRLMASDSADDVLEAVTAGLAPALNASRAEWEPCSRTPVQGHESVVLLDPSDRSRVALFVPTAEPPHYVVRFHHLAGGRRILSDDVAFLDGMALVAARRLDALRLIHERRERDIREETAANLATEAELRALQAQLNPHFLFNALNTLGYLMKAAPDRARDALLDLTKLLRAVLKRSGGGVVTLGQEIDLVEAYLAIERARFEERLRLRVDVPASLRTLLVPPLLVQPLVENAVKHGIAPRGVGGEIVVSARLERAAGAGGDTLVVEVVDSGVGVDAAALAEGRARGLGLANVEKRLRVHYGADASLLVTSATPTGTRATLRLPGRPANRPSPAGALTLAGRR
jgi:Histidine kinase/Histidine kinase-, DNA gyrase B-, and HSP90-like ATPase